MAIEQIDVLDNAVGDAMAARTIEPHAGEVGRDGHTHETHCLNCGAALVAPFCGQCGQHRHVHRTLSAFFHDFLHGVLHFDGKLWRTLPLLAWKPGELTRRYINGERASFISPMALFLFSVFLMFAVLHSVGAPIDLSRGMTVATSFDQAIANTRAELVTQQKRRSAAIAAHQSTVEIDKQIKDSLETLRVVGEMKSKGVGKSLAEASARDAAQKRAAGDTTAGNSTDGLADLESNLPQVKEAWERVRANPQLAIYQLQNGAYKFSWLLIPLSLPFLWLLFPFSRHFQLYDHTVFVTYSISFMTLLVCAAAIVAAAGAPSVTGIAAAIVPLHLYRQLKGSYGLSRLAASWRTLVLLIGSLLALTLWAILLTTMEFIN